MRVLAAFLSLTLALVSPAFAQDTPGATAQAAAEQLRRATSALQAASGARDRVKALSETVQAFETGLAAMREGLRLAKIRESALSKQLAARDGEVAELLAMLQTISRAPAPVLLAHPSGPAGAVRSGMLVAEVTPVLSRQANNLRQIVDEVALLRSLQEDAQTELRVALVGIQEARTQLSQAIANRTDLPRKFIADPVRQAILLSTTETLDAFAAGLSKITTSEILAPLPDIAQQKGALPVPVQGRVLRQFGQKDASGIARPGWIIATRPGALVTAPTAATLRYHGPLLNYGNVVILEPQKDLLLILAGLDTLYGEIGQVFPEGYPIGLMQGASGATNSQTDQIVSQASEGAGQDLSETLYIEIREKNTPVDPANWFAATRN